MTVAPLYVLRLYVYILSRYYEGRANVSVICLPWIPTGGPIIMGLSMLGLTFHGIIGGDYLNHSISTNALIKRLHNVIGILLFVE